MSGRLHKQTRGNLAKCEWLFGDRKVLPQDQTKAAYCWEFSLESPSIIAEVLSVREKAARKEKNVDLQALRNWHTANPFPGVVDSKRLSDWNRKLEESFPDYRVTTELRDYDLQFLCNWPEFPKLHWLEVSEEIRQKTAKGRYRPLPGVPNIGQGPESDEYWGFFETFPAIFFKTEYGLACHTEVRPGSRDIARFEKYVPTTKTPFGVMSEDRWTEYRLVSFSWARSDRKLKDDFAEWLKKNRPDDRQPFHKSNTSTSRRTTESDILKALGAFRLLRHFRGDWLAAAEYSQKFFKDKKGQPKPLYVEQSEWADADKRAREHLQVFEKRAFEKKGFG
jgi:hypothetical protein